MQALIEKSMNWLSESVFPLWLDKGFDSTSGVFIESLNSNFQPTTASRRAMVQARQIYSCTEALKMKILSPDVVIPLIEKATSNLIRVYSLPSGAFLHTIDSQGNPDNLQSELYTQAFVLFGLARSYALLKNEFYKKRALELVNYLNSERKAANGGYTEIKNGQILFQSNPHMHLFEAVIEWARIDNEPVWKNLCENIFNLCEKHFIDSKTGFLAEHFDEEWKPLLQNNRFIFEPGHQYEWAWLFIQFEKTCATPVGALPEQLFKNGELYGIKKSEGLAFDEIWSDHQIKKASSKFWPQSERVKAALEIGLRSTDRKKYALVADEAMQALWVFLDNAPKGLWLESKLEDGSFTKQDAKASSLYHIINAMSEYAFKRSFLN